MAVPFSSSMIVGLAGIVLAGSVSADGAEPAPPEDPLPTVAGIVAAPGARLALGHYQDVPSSVYPMGGHGGREAGAPPEAPLPWITHGKEALGGYQLGYAAARVRYDLLLGMGYEHVRAPAPSSPTLEGEGGARPGGEVLPEAIPVVFTRIGAGPVFETSVWQGRLHLGMKYPVEVAGVWESDGGGTVIPGTEGGAGYHDARFIRFDNRFDLGRRHLSMAVYYNQYSLPPGEAVPGQGCRGCLVVAGDEEREVMGVDLGLRF
ncbi:MAG: hypothetical protein ACLFTM_10340 [Ectothiorhodospira sp.]